MVHRVLLTQEFVDALEPPLAGEAWIADGAVRGFGVRLWAGKGGGNASYAIRVRNHSGRIVRESFSPWSGQSWRAQDKAYELAKSGNFQPALGFFLEEAREWAIERLAVLRSRLSSAERKARRYQQASDLVASFTLEKMADNALRRLRRSGRNEDYLIQLIKLVDHIPSSVRQSRMTDINVREIAAAIANPQLPLGQSRALQAFVGQLYKRADRWNVAIGRKPEAINRRVFYLRRKQDVPYPPIKEISDADLKAFFQKLEREESCWRQALAIRLYFETGAKMRRVKQARRSHIINGTWYPYLPAERRLWFMGREKITEEAERILGLASSRLADEGRVSDYIFPSVESDQRPLGSVWRYWQKIRSTAGWDELPLGHIVLRHRPSSTPSYIYMCYDLFVPIYKNTLDAEAVSKLANLQPDKY